MEDRTTPFFHSSAQSRTDTQENIQGEMTAMDSSNGLFVDKKGITSTKIEENNFWVFYLLQMKWCDEMCHVICAAMLRCCYIGTALQYVTILMQYQWPQSTVHFLVF
ncbi:hypothetical protein ANANG_G00301550 [Anguilla anguilla]|uniref:Uncharacterized protein n=1 Tax=Anguilla anguilla TaxID=7936 RepID=A0A9D3RI85_ANGAN|nr:hypothetical protein ANANG_G00301550 [Anguilla anguilla]